MEPLRRSHEVRLRCLRPPPLAQRLYFIGKAGDVAAAHRHAHVAGTDLSEWHSGYRAYSVAALRSINVGANSDGFDFDTEVLLQAYALELYQALGLFIPLIVTNCVILGRCADYVLSDYPKLMRVFLYGDRKDRLKRIIEDYGYDPQTAEEEMNKIDKGRAGYIKYYTGSVWTDHRTHDIMLNTSRCGIEGSVKVLLNFAEAFFKG